MNDDRFEDAVAKELAAYQEQLERGGSSDRSVSPADAKIPGAEFQPDAQQELPSELQQELDEAKRCLDLLHAMREPPNSRGKPAYGQERDLDARPTERFQRLDELGSGGFGIVWRARDPVTGRIVALKVPRPEVLASPELRKRFEQEAEAAARLDHPNIVPILEAGAEGIVPYIASVYYDGPTLARWLSAHEGPVPPRQTALIALYLAKALTHAHERGVLHRDVKPSNVLLAPVAEGEARELPFEPKLMDFGLAKLGERDQELTRTGAMLGTLKYMAPEQAAGRAKEITAATDVYGLGVVLYEMLAGAPPFSGDSDWLTLRQVLEDEPRSMSSVRRDVPRDLAVIVQKCLSKSPAQRYHSARELADDLERYLTGKAIVARPVSTVERLGKWCRRNPAWATLLAVISLSMVSGLAFLSYSNARISAALASEQRTHEQLARRLYTADIRRADEAIKRQSVRHARDILQQYAIEGAAADRREFAWHYLWARLPRHRTFTPKHPGPVYSIDLSPDDKLLATACADGRVRVWTTAGKSIFEFACDPAEPNEVTFSPDGKWLAAACDDGLVRVWEVGSWALKQTIEIGGVMTTDLDQNGDVIRAIAIQENGAIVAAGHRITKDYDAVVARYLSNGTLDRSFSATGTEIIWSSPSNQALDDVLVDPDGKIVVAGHHRHRFFAIGRLNPDGSSDTSFADQGRLVANLGAEGAQGKAIARQPDGRYIVAGSCTHNGQDDSAIVRLLPDGKLDASFGVEGIAHLKLSDFADSLNSISLQADGKILLAGRAALQAGTPGATDTVVVRCNIDGTLDPSFAQAGVLVVHVTDSDEGANRVVALPDGKVLVNGYGTVDGKLHAILFRLNSDGAFDRDFGDQGILKLDFEGKGSIAISALPLPDGRILVGGTSGKGAGKAIALTRLEADGSVDANFGRAGLATLAIGTRAEMYSMAIQPDGKVVVAGAAMFTASALSQDLLIARFMPDGSLDRSLSANGAQGVRFTPDSKQIIVYADQAVRFWELESGQLRGQLQATTGSLRSVDLSGDGTRIGLACDAGYEVWLTDKLSSPIKRKLTNDTLASMALLPNDELMLGFARGELQVDRLTGQLPPRELEISKTRRPRNIRVSPDRRWLTAVSDNSVSVYATEGTSRVAEVVTQGRVFDARIGPGGRSVLTGSVDGDVWEWPFGTEASSLPNVSGRLLYHAPTRLRACALSPDQKTFACGHADGLTCLLDAVTGAPLHTVVHHKSEVKGLVFARSNELVVGFASGSIAVLDTTDNSWREATSLGHPIHRLVISGDGHRIGVAWGDSQTVEVFDTSRFARIARIALRGSGERLSLSQDGERIAVAGGGHLQVFDVASGKTIASESGLGNTYDDVQVFPGEPRLAVAERANGIAIRDLRGRVIRRMLPDDGGVDSVAVTPDGRNLASYGVDRVIRIWDAESDEQLLMLHDNLGAGRKWGMFFSADGRSLYGFSDTSVVVWETR